MEGRAVVVAFVDTVVLYVGSGAFVVVICDSVVVVVNLGCDDVIGGDFVDEMCDSDFVEGEIVVGNKGNKVWMLVGTVVSSITLPVVKVVKTGGNVVLNSCVVCAGNVGIDGNVVIGEGEVFVIMGSKVVSFAVIVNVEMTDGIITVGLSDGSVVDIPGSFVKILDSNVLLVEPEVETGGNVIPFSVVAVDRSILFVVRSVDWELTVEGLLIVILVDFSGNISIVIVVSPEVSVPSFTVVEYSLVVSCSVVVISSTVTPLFVVVCSVIVNGLAVVGTKFVVELVSAVTSGTLFSVVVINLFVVAMWSTLVTVTGGRVGFAVTYICSVVEYGSIIFIVVFVCIIFWSGDKVDVLVIGGRGILVGFSGVICSFVVSGPAVIVIGSLVVLLVSNTVITGRRVGFIGKSVVEIGSVIVSVIGGNDGFVISIVACPVDVIGFKVVDIDSGCFVVTSGSTDGVVGICDVVGSLVDVIGFIDIVVIGFEVVTIIGGRGGIVVSVVIVCSGLVTKIVVLDSDVAVTSDTVSVGTDIDTVIGKGSSVVLSIFVVSVLDSTGIDVTGVSVGLSFVEVGVSIFVIMSVLEDTIVVLDGSSVDEDIIVTDSDVTGFVTVESITTCVVTLLVGVVTLGKELLEDVLG